MAPPIGNLDTGIAIPQIWEKYIQEYSSKSIPRCSKCWALQLCPVCYLHAFSMNAMDMARKERNCLAIRDAKERHLRLYAGLLEANKSGLDFINEWQLA